MEKWELKRGMPVKYRPAHGKIENGVIKSWNDSGVFVVYNCGGNWDHYKDYTGCNTNPRDLRPGWADKKDLKLHQQIKN